MSLLFSGGAACVSGPQVPELCAARFTLTFRINATNTLTVARAPLALRPLRLSQRLRLAPRNARAGRVLR